MDELCVNCYFFEEMDSETHAGQCRYMPPRGIDDKSIPDGIAPINVFPSINDATIEFCGDFRQNE